MFLPRRGLSTAPACAERVPFRRVLFAVLIVAVAPTTEIGVPRAGFAFDGDGDALGTALGDVLGCALGDMLGCALGEMLGCALGEVLGCALGEVLGCALGETLGRALGMPLGRMLGVVDGRPTGGWPFGLFCVPPPGCGWTGFVDGSAGERWGDCANAGATPAIKPAIAASAAIRFFIQLCSGDDVGAFGYPRSTTRPEPAAFPFSKDFVRFSAPWVDRARSAHRSDSS